MTEEDLKKIICNTFLDGDMDFPIKRETKLLEEGICDSLGLVQLVAQIEASIQGIKISDQEITRDNFGSIGAMLDFLISKGV